MSALLEARGLRFFRGKFDVVGGIDLDIAPGEVLALVGPNGAGKSTLVQLLAGLLSPAGGVLKLRGETITTRAQRRAYRQRVTLVFQNPLLFNTTVEANVATGLRLRGLPTAERQARVARIAARLGLTGLLGRAARTLSGGEAQRTALARALVLKPDVLFLDEPFSALDEPTREALTVDLGAALRETCTAAVLVTHHLGEALCVADGLAVIMDGRIRQRGPILGVINRPADDAVAAFVARETQVVGTVIASERGIVTLDCGGGVGGAPVGRRVQVGVRAGTAVTPVVPSSD